MDYSPKLTHAIIVLLLGTALFCGSAYWPVAAVFLQIAGGICWGLCFYVAWMLGAEIRTRLYDAAAYFADAIKNVPEDRLDAIGIAFPKVSLRWRGGDLTETFEDTNVPFALFERYMRDSRPNYVSPVRNWPKGTQLQAWEAITAWLIREHYVIPDSASGNQSLLWYERMYDLAWSRYMTPRYLPQFPESHSPTVSTSLSDVGNTLGDAKPQATQEILNG
jgi:hypothetical protein